jgi:GAF domain/ANTAR domain
MRQALADRCSPSTVHGVEVTVARKRVTEILFAVLGPGDDVAPASRLVRLCAGNLPVSGAGLAFMSPQGHGGTVATTDEAAAELEDLQFTLGEGPCLDASRTGRPVLVPDLVRTGPARWPAFADEAQAAGVRAVFALPLRVGAIRVGVLDLYRDASGGLAPPDLTEALAFADAATTLLLHLQTGGDLADRPLDTVAGLDDRAEVHQATGVVSVHNGVGLDEALMLLRARAYADQRPIGDVAKDVLSGKLRLVGDDGEGGDT